MSEELKITKEKVLEAANKCSTAKQVLETMFPEVFGINKPKEPEYLSIYAVKKSNVNYVCICTPSKNSGRENPYLIPFPYQYVWFKWDEEENVKLIANSLEEYFKKKFAGEL